MSTPKPDEFAGHTPMDIVETLRISATRFQTGVPIVALLKAADEIETTRAQRNALLEACKALMARIESGYLVRDVGGDAKADWSISAARFVLELKTAQQAIAQCESGVEK